MHSIVIERLPICTPTGPARGRSSRRSSAEVTKAVPCVCRPRRSTTFCWEDERHGARVDDAVDGRAADVGFGAVAAAEVLAVACVLQNDVGVNLSHARHRRRIIPDNGRSSTRGIRHALEHPAPLQQRPEGR